MPPKTTLALRATVVAAGLAAAGTSTAAAAPAPGMEGLRSAPDELGQHHVLNSCRAQDDPHPERCPEVEAGLRTPTVLKQVGVDVVRGGNQVREDLAHPGPPVGDGRVGRALDDLGGVAQGVQDQAKTRPDVTTAVRPGESPVLKPNSPQSRFLDAHVGPRGHTHQGVSAVDTAVDANAVQGYDIGRGTLPDALVPSLPPEAGVPAHPVPPEAGVPKDAVPTAKSALPAAQPGPSASAQLDQRVLRPGQQAADDLLHRVQAAGQTVDKGAGQLLRGETLPLQVDDAAVKGH